jgi:threonine/homoserine/homoserine lactone efflux protein
VHRGFKVLPAEPLSAKFLNLYPRRTVFELVQTQHLWLYFLLVAGIIVLPGMDMAFVLASSLVDGRRGGAAAVAGIVAGGMVHVAMSGFGIGLILLSAPRLFNALLLVGTLYVAWMGWGLIRGAAALATVRIEAPRSAWATFGRAALTCLLNPKAYVFMLAVFPQFVRAEYGSLVGQSVWLGAITSLTQVAVYGAVVLASVRLRAWLLGNGHAQVLFGRAVGGLLLLVAGWTAWQGWHPDV